MIDEWNKTLCSWLWNQSSLTDFMVLCTNCIGGCWCGIIQFVVSRIVIMPMTLPPMMADPISWPRLYKGQKITQMEKYFLKVGCSPVSC